MQPAMPTIKIGKHEANNYRQAQAQAQAEVMKVLLWMADETQCGDFSIRYSAV